MNSSNRGHRFARGVWNSALVAVAEHKVRAFLSMLGVVIGSASIVLVITAGTTGGRYVIEQIEAVGSNVAYAELTRTGSAQPALRADEITVADLNAVRTEIAGVSAAAGSRDIPITVAAAGSERAVTLIGVTAGFQEIRRLAVTAGRYFDGLELETGSKVCVLSEELAAAMFPRTSPIGKVAHVGDLRLTVVGVFRERASTFGASEIQRESVVVPFRQLRTFTGTEFIKVLYAQAASPDAVDEVTESLRRLLERRHRPGARYRVENLNGILDAARRISAALSITLIAIALVALVVSGVGIMNVMLVTVAERAHEIGLRKAIGAPRRTILAQFLIEAGLISGAGAILGVLLAVSLVIPAGWLLPAGLSPQIPPWSILLALGVSASVGIVFGYLPAQRAASLQPVDALRHE